MQTHSDAIAFNPKQPKLGDLDFTVSKVPMFIGGAGKQTEVPRHAALTRDDDGSVVTVVGANYGVVQNTELFRDIDAQLASTIPASGLKGAKVRNSIAHNGKLSMREYAFPNFKHSKTLADKKANLHFRLLAINGYGGSSLQVITGAFDGYCLNGTVFGEAHARVSAKHSRRVSVVNIVPRVKAALELFPRMCELYDTWAGKKLTDAQVEAFLKATKFSAKSKGKLFAQWQHEAQARGATVWALYSALTYYASHAEGAFAFRNTGRDHGAATLLNRERKVVKTMKLDAWKKLAPQLAS